jgi:hypothetical protein
MTMRPARNSATISWVLDIDMRFPSIRVLCAIRYFKGFTRLHLSKMPMITSGLRASQPNRQELLQRINETSSQDEKC